MGIIKMDKDYKKILEDHKEDFDVLERIVRELNSWDGSFEELDVQPFDKDFFDNYFSDKMEVARATFFGDIKNWMDEYIRFNGYGNLESLSQYQYEKELVESGSELIERALEEADNIDLDYITEDLE